MPPQIRHIDQLKRLSQFVDLFSSENFAYQDVGHQSLTLSSFGESKKSASTPAAGINAASMNTGSNEKRSTILPVMIGKSHPLNPPAMPVSAVTLAVALLGKRSEIAANIFAESA